MILVLEKGLDPTTRNQLKSILAEQKCMIHDTGSGSRNVMGVIGKCSRDYLMSLDGVSDVIPISTSYKLVSRQLQKEDTIITVKDVTVGGSRIAVIAGPCAVESREQALTIAREVKKYGATLFRGGAYKPRSSPYSFQGLEEKGLEILAEVREKTGLPVVTEITSPMQAEVMKQYVDVVQIGARNMQNFELLKCVGRMGLPVVLKRGLAATIEEWLMSAEYIASEGNTQIILCERGIRTFEPFTRNTLDLSAIPVLKQLTHLPVVIDPSHATGIREKVSPMARAAVAAGADALMIEVHHRPEEALSDGPQSLYPHQFGRLIRDIYVIAPVVGKQLHHDYTTTNIKRDVDTESSGATASQVAYLGEQGTFSHKAALHYFGEEMGSYPMPTFRNIFEEVKSGRARYGIVPIENALSGSIHENYDLLLEFELNITGEMRLRVEHHLIGHPGTRADEMTRVYAPPPAFQQCRRFLDARPEMQQIPVNATGSAVKRVAESGVHTHAAIGSLEAARFFDMAVLEESIEDNPRNFTRFVIIEKEPRIDGILEKSSIVFSTPNKPGALYAVMKDFAQNGINLVKLESRPIHGKPWQYMFYADLETDITGEGAPLLEVVGRNTEFVRVLGSYPAGGVGKPTPA